MKSGILIAIALSSTFLILLGFLFVFIAASGPPMVEKRSVYYNPDTPCINAPRGIKFPPGFLPKPRC